jgi:cell division protein FtsN
MQRENGKQWGGTLLGVVIGLVAGLAIALVVALMITKSPVPFNSKGKSDKPAVGNVSPSADPNQPMYRNKQAPEAAKEADPAKALEAQPAKTDVKSDAVPVAKGEAKETTPVNKPEEKTTYYLQAGAFKNTNDAENMRARLALLGFEASISEMITSNGTLYRVRVGPFSQAETMNRMRVRLAENGIEASVMRIPK